MSVDLIAVLVAVIDGEPKVLTLTEVDALPSGPFEQAHRSLQSGVRAWVEQQTHQPIGYIEQLYTFADRDRTAEAGASRSISISYLGLTRPVRDASRVEARWRDWYRYFPWEDHRAGAPAIIGGSIAPRLEAWCRSAGDASICRERRSRAALTFGLDGAGWNEELVLQRYELLFEAGLIDEARRGCGGAEPDLAGASMAGDHRRILATGIARLRAKIKYRPVVFELMPDSFTLLQLQRCVEALAGVTVHKQNFRRLVESQDLIEETGAVSADTGGRPAKLFRFRRAVLEERGAVGTKIPVARS